MELVLKLIEFFLEKNFIFVAKIFDLAHTLNDVASELDLLLETILGLRLLMIL